MIKLNPGQRIGFSVKFLKSIGASHELGYCRGEFVGTKKVGQRELCVVQWDEDDETKLTMRNSIAPVGANIEFCQC